MAARVLKTQGLGEGTVFGETFAEEVPGSRSWNLTRSSEYQEFSFPPLWTHSTRVRTKPVLLTALGQCSPAAVKQRESWLGCHGCQALWLAWIALGNLQQPRQAPTTQPTTPKELDRSSSAFARCSGRSNISRPLCPGVSGSFVSGLERRNHYKMAFSSRLVCGRRDHWQPQLRSPIPGPPFLDKAGSGSIRQPQTRISVRMSRVEASRVDKVRPRDSYEVTRARVLFEKDTPTDDPP